MIFHLIIVIFSMFIIGVQGLWWHSWFRHGVKSWKDAGLIPDNPPGHGVDSASDRNVYQKYFLGVKAASA
jgi:hypothetical protein